MSAWTDTPLGRYAPPPEPDYPDGVPRDVCRLFERFAFEVIAAGMARYSARAICHRIRWHCRVEQKMDDFKINNNVTPLLARWFMRKHPSHGGFFETRRADCDD